MSGIFFSETRPLSSHVGARGTLFLLRQEAASSSSKVRFAVADQDYLLGPYSRSIQGAFDVVGARVFHGSIPNSWLAVAWRRRVHVIFPGNFVNRTPFLSPKKHSENQGEMSYEGSPVKAPPTD